MNNKKRISIISLVFILILLSFLYGCSNNNAVSGYTITDIQRSTINNGETTSALTKALNTGKIAGNFRILVSAHNLNNVKVTYPNGPLEFRQVQPDEYTPEGAVNIQANTDSIEQKFGLTVFLIDMDTNKQIYSAPLELKVKGR